MKYALINGIKTSIDDVERGTIAKDGWFNEYDVLACKGHYMSYWRYLDERPDLPEGYENETEWHASWKSLVHDEYCEVICGPNNEHRADILTNEYVIEIQNSPIAFDSVKSRIDFYYGLTGNRVIWIINAYSAWKNIETYFDRGRLKVKWKYPKKWVKDICGWKSTIVFLDVSPRGKNLLKIWQYQGELYGKWVKKHDFYLEYLFNYSEEIDDFSNVFRNINVRDYL